MIDLPNFGHIIKSTIWFESRDKVLLVTSWTEVLTSEPLFQNTIILRKPRVANLAGIIKITTMFIKITIKGWKKVKRIRNYILKCSQYLYFLIKQKLLIYG